MLADLETCYVIVCRSSAGPGGPDTHVHDCDQFYYVLDGTMNVVFGETEHTAEPESRVFIPRGTAHRNRTVGAQPETHIDILVPPPARGELGASDTAPAAVAGRLAAAVRYDSCDGAQARSAPCLAPNGNSPRKATGQGHGYR
jgi:mannose-6-phosphate isomerase-like protein (cupin superfamily)